MEDLEINNLIEKKINECGQTCDYNSVLKKEDFWKIIGAYTLVLTIALGYLATRMTTVENKVVDSQLSNVRIETQLAQIRVDLADIKVSFMNHEKETKQ